MNYICLCKKLWSLEECMRLVTFSDSHVGELLTPAIHSCTTDVSTKGNIKKFQPAATLKNTAKESRGTNINTNVKIKEEVLINLGGRSLAQLAFFKWRMTLQMEKLQSSKKKKKKKKKER